MKHCILVASLLVISLVGQFKAQAQNPISIEIDLVNSSTAVSSTALSSHIDSVAVDLLITHITSVTSISATITEIGNSAAVQSRSATIPNSTLSASAISAPGSSTANKSVRISLTKKSYKVGDPSKPLDIVSDAGPADLINVRPWKLPLRITINDGGRKITVDLYKNYPYTGSILLDAARLDSLRMAKDPAVYTFLQNYAKWPNAIDTQLKLQNYFKENVSLTLSSISSLTTVTKTQSTSLNATSITSTSSISATIVTPASLTTVVRNPYLASFVQSLSVAIPTSSTLVNNELGNDKSLTSGGSRGATTSLGSLSNPALAADALATFIARRFKEEVNVAFLNEFRQKLTIDSTLGIVFPRTKEIMLAIDPYQYTTFLESMKTAFEEDLKQLPGNSATLLDSLSHRKQLKISTDRLVLSKVALQTLQRTLDDKNDYWGALRVISPSTVTLGSDTLKSVLFTGSLLINSVLDTANQVRLPTPAALTKKDYTGLVLGLMLARHDSLLQQIQTTFKRPTSPSTPIVSSLGSTTTTIVSTSASAEATSFLSYALHTGSGTLTPLTNAVSEFGKALLSFDESLKKIQEKKKKEQAKEDITSFNQTVILDAKAQRQQKLISYTDFALSITKVLDRMLAVETIFKDIPAVKIRQRIIKPVQDGIQAFKNIQEKEYALAVIYTANMLVALTSRNDSTDSRTTLALKKYGSFMTSVIAAETRDQMLEALETAALPVGSYRIKRNNFFNIAINTYGGFAVGRHYLKEITSPPPSTTPPSSATASGTTNESWLVAPYAPLGISFAWGRNADYVNLKDHGSIGFHVNLIDVGAIALVRLSDETASLPEFTWKNLLAPGLSVIWGLPKKVWTLSGGVQVGPELRQVKLDQAKNIIDTKQWRFGVTLSADIPVFNVFTQANHRKIRTLEKSTLEIEAGKGADEGMPTDTDLGKADQLEKKSRRLEERAARKRIKAEQIRTEQKSTSTAKPVV